MKTIQEIPTGDPRISCRISIVVIHYGKFPGKERYQVDITYGILGQNEETFILWPKTTKEGARTFALERIKVLRLRLKSLDAAKLTPASSRQRSTQSMGTRGIAPDPKWWRR